MRVFESRWFERFAKREGISDAAKLEAVERAEQGQIDADLGGEVIKQRIGRAGQGKSRGWRTIIFFRRGKRAILAYGFAKNQRENLDTREVAQFKEAAKHALRLSGEQIEALCRRGSYVEVKSNEQEVPQ